MRRGISLVGGSVAGGEGVCCIVLYCIVLGEGWSIGGEKADWNYVMIGMTCSFILK